MLLKLSAQRALSLPSVNVSMLEIPCFLIQGELASKPNAADEHEVRRLLDRQRTMIPFGGGSTTGQGAEDRRRHLASSRSGSLRLSCATARRMSCRERG